MYKQNPFLNIVSKVLLLPIMVVLIACSEEEGGSAPKQFFNPDSTPAPAPVLAPTDPLAAVVITNPGGATKVSNASSLVIEGSCESGASVAVAGDATATASCVSGTFSLSVAKSTDGTFSFSVSQSRPEALESTPVVVSWVRDTVAPFAPTLGAPSSDPFTSADSNLTLSGTCETGALVSLAGAATDNQTCNANAYSFTVSKSVDGTYDFSLTQIDVAGNISAAKTLQWLRDSSIPVTPVIATPAVTPYYSNSGTLVISGSCTTGHTVMLSGDDSNSVACVANSFSFTVSEGADGSYNYSILQKNLTNISSAPVAIVWNRDTVSPSAPTVASPSMNPKYSNGSTLTISGACENGATVTIAGALSSTSPCSSNSYSFTVNKVVDGTYSFSLSQSDPAGNSSGSLAFSWIRDTVVPAKPTLISPSSSPLASGDTNIVLTANCEPNASIAMTGAATGSATCSALGQFSMNISKSVDGTYDFSLTQTDLAMNTSASLAFQWIRDTSVPFTPVIVVPVSTPSYSNQDSISIQATCDDSLSPNPAVVELAGALVADEVSSPAGSLTQDCVASPVTFVVQKSSDGSYDFSVSQENPNSGMVSAAASLVWVRDTAAPSAPTITNPVSSPFVAPGNLILSGSCEANATVLLSGDETQSTPCSGGGSYTFNVTRSVDATYNFAVAQTDRAGNSSSGTAFQWVRDSNSVPAPTLTSPSVTPVLSNTDTLMISGNCNSGYLVTLSGDVSAAQVTTPLNSLTQTCNGGTFTYVVQKPADGVYNFNLIQTFNAVNSSATNLQWTRDMMAPTVNLTSSPNDPNLSVGGDFVFESTEAGSTFECKLDSEVYASCSSPVSYPSFTNGPRSFSVRATDLAGNVSTEVSYSWVQAAHSAVALYHLDSGAPLDDSSLYTQAAIVDHTLEQMGTPTTVTGKFGNGLRFGSNIALSTPTSIALENALSTLTIEGQFQMSTTIATTGNYYTLLAKSGGPGEIGWEVRLRKSTSSRYVLDFVFSKDGTTLTTVSTANQNISTSNWYYFAVTWNKGQTKLYFNSATANRTNGTVGTATLFNSSADLTLGKGPSTGTGAALWFGGSLDEVRISQTVRTIVKPTTAFTAD